MKTIMRNKPLMRLAVCLIGMAALVLQSCADGGTDRDRLCGSAERFHNRCGRP